MGVSRFFNFGTPYFFCIMDKEKVLKKLNECGQLLEGMTILETLHVLIPVTVGYLKAVKDEHGEDLTLTYLRLFLNSMEFDDENKEQEKEAGSETETVG